MLIIFIILNDNNNNEYCNFYIKKNILDFLWIFKKVKYLNKYII